MKFFKLLLLYSFLAGVLGLISLIGIYFYIKPDLPSVTVLKDVKLQTPLQIFTNDGKLISQYGVKRRIPVKLEDVPQDLINAVIATEDSRFFEHHGIDPIGIARAALNLLITGEKQQGASTLSMQLARGFFLTREKTYVRKIKEIFIAWHMEQLLSKEEILTLYLNKVELGHRAFGFGAAAQVYYGSTLDQLSLAQLATIAGLPKAPSALNPITDPQASMNRRRVVLLRMLDEGYINKQQFDIAAAAPVTAEKHGAEIDLDAPYLAEHIYNELVDMYGKDEIETGGYRVYAAAGSKLQQAAQDAVVQNIHDYDERHGFRGAIGKIWMTESARDNANDDERQLPTARPSEDIILAKLAEIDRIDPLIPAVVDRVNERDIVVTTVDGATLMINWEGLDWARPYVTDSKQGAAPESAFDIVEEGQIVYVREQDGQLRLSQLPDVSGAFVAINPHSGAVEAVVGGYSFYASQFNRATQAKRQVGSNIKPFIYSAAIDKGFTPASIINDAPINQWNMAAGVAWRPQNSPPEYDGPIRMRVALGKSKNVVSVRLLRAVGLEDAVFHLAKFGFALDEIPRDETVSLGSGSHSPLEVARAMSVIANGGYLVDPYFIDRVENDAGEVLWRAQPKLACDESENPVAPQELTLEQQLALELGGSLSDGPESYQATCAAPRVISAQNAFLIADMMRTGVRANGSWNKKTYWLGTGWRARNILQRADIAGKTGTTNDSRDTWFSGFHKDLVATTWLGFDDMNRNLGRTTGNRNLINRNPERYNWIGNGLVGAEDGAKAAGPAWIRFMQVALADVPHSPLTVPEDVVRVRIDRTSGLLTRRTDHTTLFEYFPLGQEPQRFIADEDIVDPAKGDTSTDEEDDGLF